MKEEKPLEESQIQKDFEAKKREHLRKTAGPNLLIRNILNGLFILLAIIAMVGVVVTKDEQLLMIWYGVGLFAVLIKMIEVIFRLPHLRK